MKERETLINCEVNGQAIDGVAALDANENINVLFNYWDMPGTQFVFVKSGDLPNYSRTKETVRDQAQDEGMICVPPIKKFQNIHTDFIMGKIPS
jgi:hypothetical protein